MASFRLPGFSVRTHGFPFPNGFPCGTPVIVVPTPFGRLAVGDASFGLCGGMVFAALDFYYHGLAGRPDVCGPRLTRYFSRRLLDSWNFPFGILKYYDWQRRPGGTVHHAGVRLMDGLTRLTIVNEWPRIRTELHAGRPAPLGVVKARGLSPWKLPQHHQVLCYGYDLDEETRELALAVYDPNYPGDDTALSIRLHDSDAEQPLRHSCEGPTVRGVFLAEYRRPAALPAGLA